MQWSSCPHLPSPLHLHFARDCRDHVVCLVHGANNRKVTTVLTLSCIHRCVFFWLCKIKSAEHVHEVHERSVDNTAQVALPQRWMQPTILVAMATVCLACAPASKKQMRSLVGCTHINRGGRSSNTKKAYNYRPAMPLTDFYTLFLLYSPFASSVVEQEVISPFL